MVPTYATRVAHDDWVSAVAFSPDGTLLATASGDRTARVNLHRPHDLIASALARGSRDLTPEEWQRFHPRRAEQPDTELE